MDADSFIVHLKTDDIYKDIAEDVETRFDTSKFEIDRPLPKEKNKKVIWLMKHELDGKSWKNLLQKQYNYLRYSIDEDEKAKGTKKRVLKRKLNFLYYKNCLETPQIERKTNYLKKKQIDVNILRKD